MRESKICLVIIYNHNFERNIAVLNRIYAGRFSDVFHVMPFYRGNEHNVIGVYENSYQFNGYVTQAIQRIKDEKYSHYLFVADDMIINPSIASWNVARKLKLDEDAGFISDFRLIDDWRFMNWTSAIPSFMNLLGGGNACEWKGFLPNAAQAREIMASHGINCVGGVSSRLFKVVRCGCRVMRQTAFRYSLLPPLGILRRHHSWLSSKDKLYPLVDGYSDFFSVPAGCIDDFCHYCGVFAAIRVFVEIAIPMALIFSCKKIVRLVDIGMKAENGIEDYSVRRQLEEKFNFRYARLIAEFPHDYLYIHPVKLSKWGDLP